MCSSPVHAEETPSSTPDIVEPETPTSTEPIVEEEEETPAFREPIVDEEEYIVLTTTTIHLQIESHDATLYDEDFVVTECPDTETGTSTTLNAWCAISQLANQQDWTISGSWGAYGVFLSAINEYDGSDFNWWGWYSELEMGMTSLDAHILSEGENILLAYGTSPLKINSSNSTPMVGTTTTITVQEFDSWNFAWIDAVSSTIVINEEEISVDGGTYEMQITTTTPYQIYGKKDGYLNTKTLTITPVANNEDDDEDDSGSSGGPSGGDPDDEVEIVGNETIQNTVNKILAYLESQQDETGKILDGNMTDWAIMSFGANGQYADDIAQGTGKTLLEYEKEYNLDSSSDLNPCASYPRHVLALLAAGVSPDDPAIVGLDNEMNACYVDGIYGQNGINDDVFALLALLAIDTDTHEEIIGSLISEIESWQLDSGAFSWPDWYDPTQKTAGDDITGAAINALKYAQNKGADIENNIFGNATAYLKTTQQTDGGWGYGATDIMTTSWVLMGLNALGQTQTDWQTQNNKNPWIPLVENLHEDGYYESVWSPGTPDWFAMKHAVPALLGASWPIILDPIVEDFSDGATYTYGGGPSSSQLEDENTTTTTDIVTSTEDIVTTTEDIVTTTLDVVTSTEEIIPTAEIGQTPSPSTTPVVAPTPVVYTSPTPQAEVLGEKIETEDVEEDDEDIEEDEKYEEETQSEDKDQREEKGTPNPLKAFAVTGGLALIFVGWKLIKFLI